MQAYDSLIRRARPSNAAGKTIFFLYPARIRHQSSPTVDKKIRHVHESQEAAFDELLSYWKDRKTSHINTGADMFKQALIECDDTIKDLNKILDSYGPKKS